MSGSIRVLHVDDDPTLGDLVATFLEEEDDRISVVTVEDASEALAALDDHDIDCVVSDYDMPHMNGLQLLDAVRERSPGLPFILFTGKGSEEIAGEAISRGVDDYLQKETGTEQYAVLANRIGNVVDQYRSERDEQLFRTLIDHATDAVFVIDEETGRFVDVNETATERLGYDRDQLLGMSTYEVSESFDDHEEYLEYMAGAGGDETLTTEDTHVRADGSTVPVEVSASNVEVGEESYRVAIAREITDRKRYEQTLEELHEATRELLKTTDKRAAAEAAVSYVEDVLGHPIAGIWLHDEDGDALEPVVWTDSADAVVGDHPTFAADEPSITWDVFENGEPTYVADVRDDPDRYSDGAAIRSELVVPLGRYGVLNVGATTAEAFDDSDLAIARIWAATVTMVLVRIERERQLKRREAEVSRERDRLEEFASLVSHDLRSPLNVAAGNLEIVTDRLAEESIDAAELGAVKRSLDRMDALIEDLLALARQGAGIDETEPVALSDLAAECWTTVDTESATLSVETETAVAADRSRLRQALENLFGNAVEHVGPDVAVAIGALDGGDGFYVADDGPGIDPDRRDEVFEAGMTTDPEGTGFGLKIVAEVAEAHGWTVALVESEGGGARFEFRGVDLDPGDASGE